jgi:phosphatidylserine decarboxylase
VRDLQPTHQPIVAELIALLGARPDLEAALTHSLRKADRPGVGTLTQYYEFLDEMVTLIPTDRNLKPVLLNFYYLIDLSPDRVLQADESFQNWTRKFAEDWGRFLDTTASAEGIPGFISNPDYRIEEYCVSPSGWLTFNQFFARQVRPGRRPVDGRCDDSTIVSPADSVYLGQWPISDESTITAKGMTSSVMALLDGSPHQSRFCGGVFTHSFLNVNDYHRFHVPVGGSVLEVRKIPGRASQEVIVLPDGSLDCVDGTGFQFTQDRGLIIIDSPCGLVAVLPIGMAQVSSVNLTAQAGATLVKGEEFGFFSFGGSDIVTLFEASRIELDAVVGTHYNQGRAIGHAINKDRL